MFTWGHLYTNVHLNQYRSVERISKWMFLKDFGHFHVFVIESKRLKSDWYHTSLCVEGLIDYLYIWGLFSSPGAVMISSMFTFFVPTCVTWSLRGIQVLQALLNQCTQMTLLRLTDMVTSRYSGPSSPT